MSLFKDMTKGPRGAINVKAAKEVMKELKEANGDWYDKISENNARLRIVGTNLAWAEQGVKVGTLLNVSESSFNKPDSWRKAKVAKVVPNDGGAPELWVLYVRKDGTFSEKPRRIYSTFTKIQVIAETEV